MQDQISLVWDVMQDCYNHSGFLFLREAELMKLMKSLCMKSLNILQFLETLLSGTQR